MTLANVLAFARAQAQTDSNGLTDTNGIIFANEALSDFHRRLVNAGVDASQLQESYTSGTANQGTYLWPTDMLFNKAIELDYTGAGGQQYRPASQVDVSNLPYGSFSWLRANADAYNPLFDDRGDWFEIFPTPTTAISNLIRIFYYLKPTEFTATTDTVSYPENMDTAILGWRIAAMYKYSQQDFISGDAYNQKYDERVTQYIATLSRGTQQPLQSTSIQLTGFEF